MRCGGFWDLGIRGSGEIGVGSEILDAFLCWVLVIQSICEL